MTENPVPFTGLTIVSDAMVIFSLSMAVLKSF